MTTARQQTTTGRSVTEMRATLTAIGKDLRTGALYKGVGTLVRNVRRDTSKLGKALQGDVERLVTAGVGPPKRA